MNRNVEISAEEIEDLLDNLISRMIGEDNTNNQQEQEDRKNYILPQFDYNEIISCMYNRATFDWKLTRYERSEKETQIYFLSDYLKPGKIPCEIYFSAIISAENEGYILWNTDKNMIQLTSEQADDFLKILIDTNPEYKEYKYSLFKGEKLRLQLYKQEQINIPMLQKTITEIILSQSDWEYCTEEEHRMSIDEYWDEGTVQKYFSYQGFVLAKVSKVKLTKENTVSKSEIKHELLIAWKDRIISVPIKLKNKTTLYLDAKGIEEKSISDYFWMFVDLIKEKFLEKSIEESEKGETNE